MNVHVYEKKYLFPYNATVTSGSGISHCTCRNNTKKNTVKIKNTQVITKAGEESPPMMLKFYVSDLPSIV